MSRHRAPVAVEAMHGAVPYGDMRPLIVSLKSSRHAEAVATGCESANSDVSESVTESETSDSLER